MILMMGFQQKESTTTRHLIDYFSFPIIIPSTVRGFSGEKRGMKNKVCIGR